MRKSVLLTLGAAFILIITGLLASCSAQPDQATQDELTKLREENKLLKEIAGPLPESLDNYFPPKAPAPIWLLEMFTLDNKVIGMYSDLQQGDFDGAKTNFAAFKAQYEKLSKMVPEWSGYFPMAPIDEFGKALDSGDPAKVGAAFGAVGEVCANCHSANLIKAQQKYHWPSFDNLDITNPLSGQPAQWGDIMFQLSGTFVGIGNDLEQGQLENARNNFQAFSATFKALPETCENCHDTPRYYFVDDSVQEIVVQLGAELAKDTPDPAKVGELSGAIGNEACMKCHLVHMPAPAANKNWDRFADLFK